MRDTRTLIDALATHLGSALGAMTGTAVRAMPTAGTPSVDWQVPLQVGGASVGTIWLGLTGEGATRLVAAFLGDPRLVAEPDVVETLKELLGQTAEALVASEGPGLTIAVDSPVPSLVEVTPDAQHYDLMVDASEPIRIVGWGQITAGRVSELAPTVSAGAPSVPPPVSTGLASPPPRNLDVVLDIELPITVRFGETQMALESLARLGPGSMIDLARAPDDPVDLLVNGRLVARGQVVVVSGCYGVRVNEVVSPADRLRSLEL